ncbi:MAG: hypothetical protein V8Q91_16965 [Bilophila wadsworthia]|uniref:hypothetical protein n=1 Tax=Bilophila wadsworthia TaxID=35833 RepID=UPI00300F3FB0
MLRQTSPSSPLFLPKLSKLYKIYDCQTLEINAFVMTGENTLFYAELQDGDRQQRHVPSPRFRDQIARDLPAAQIWTSSAEPSKKPTPAAAGFLMNMGYDEVSPGYVGYTPPGVSVAMMGLDALLAVSNEAADYADTRGNPVAAEIYRVAKGDPLQARR